MLQKKHVECAEALLGPGKELNTFVARLLEDIANLKAMLQAISIGGCWLLCKGCWLLGKVAGSWQLADGRVGCEAGCGPAGGCPHEWLQPGTDLAGREVD